ncbi:transporter substrate-binding domain-containing protein [Pseudaeromonas sp. ZJS20]|uniref:substrate-binding periplasmic protein n=1 Tax=Pseudaeromonas aegiceratis TaxID=3153928 RepID=UPI00390CC25D
MLLRVLPLLLTLVGPALAMERLYVDANNPPLMYADAQQQAAGLYPALVNALFDRLHEPVLISPLPWKRVLRALEDGGAGVAGIYWSAERQAWLDYSAALYQERIMIYQRKGGRPLRTLADLYGLEVGVLAGWFYSQALSDAAARGELRLQPVSDDASNLGKLARGRLDAVLAVAESGDATLQRLGLTAQIVRSDTPLLNNSTHIAFPKAARRQALLTRINAALARMQADGSLQRVAQQALSATQADADRGKPRPDLTTTSP